MASPAISVSQVPAANPVTNPVTNPSSNHSTGPRTPEGKARSSQNARTHGFSAKTLEVLPAEQADFEIYQSELLETIKPQPGPQSDLFRQLLHAGWSLLRLERFELNILALGDPFESPEAQAKLDRLERYRAGHRRAYTRILNEIRKLQTDFMVWMTTPTEIQELKDVKFPLANPASSPLQPQMQQASINVMLQRASQASAHQPYDSDAAADAAFAEMMAMSAARDGRA